MHRLAPHTPIRAPRRTRKTPAPQTAPAGRPVPLHRHWGNARTVQQARANPRIGGAGDGFEQQAEAVAQAATGLRGAAPPQHTGAAAGYDVRRLNLPSLQGSGRPLPEGVRGDLEQQMGYDFSGVRVHTGAAAARAAQSIHARAYTQGRNMVFDQGAYAPDTAAGRHLLAHELAHTVQQGAARSFQTGGPVPSASGVPAVQRDEAPGVTVQSLLPFPVGSQFVMNRTLSDTLLGIAAKTQPDVAATVRAIEGQVATVTTATATQFTAVLDNDVTISGDPAVTYRNVTLQLRQSAAGTFDFSLTAESGSPPATVTLFSRRDLTATDQGGGTTHLANAEGTNELRFQTAGDRVSLAGFTAPFADQIPKLLRGGLPPHIDLINLTQLPPAKEGTSAQKTAIEQAAAQAQRGRRVPRQQVSVSGGASVVGGDVYGMLGLGWQMNFTPIDVAGSFFQVPLFLQAQYVPDASFLASASTGVGTSLSALEIPLNIYLTTGLAGGRLPVSEEAGGGTQGAFGLLPGVGVGGEFGAIRVNVRYEYLWNWISNSPNAHNVIGGAGVAF